MLQYELNVISQISQQVANLGNDILNIITPGLSGSIINDTAVSSTQTWSSAKIEGFTNIVSTFYQQTPGAYNVTVPANAGHAVISAVGGGGAGAIGVAEGVGGGGGAGGIINFPLPVQPGQIIATTVGQGGLTPGGNGTASIINVGTFTISCGGGFGGSAAALVGIGGAGGTVSGLPFASPFNSVTGGAGGNNTGGANGSVGLFAYSGAGGGSGNVSNAAYNGGSIGLCVGGSSAARLGSGGASPFYNGGSVIISNGNFGSGGPAFSPDPYYNNIGFGGSGFVEIVFTA